MPLLLRRIADKVKTDVETDRPRPQTRPSSLDLDIHPSSYVDPNGFVFWHNDTIFRAIHPERAAFYQSLFEDGTVNVLIAKDYLVESRIVDLSLPELRHGLTIQHQTIEPLTYCVEWCPAMLRDAARVTVDLALSLVDYRCTLQDAYPWNVLVRGSQPVFVDFTSIVREHPTLPWPAYNQFQAFFLRALYLSELGKGKIARALLTDYLNGISVDEFYRHLPVHYRFRHPGLFIEHRLNRLVQRKAGLKSGIRRLSTAQRQRIDGTVRRGFFKRLSTRLESLRFQDPYDLWGRYYESIPEGVNREVKLTTVGSLLEKLAPATVTDLGCNLGVFSILAAECGARVLAIDSSEQCISNLYTRAKSDDLAITPIIADVLNPTVPFGFLGTQFAGLIERAIADVVLCLGLMHHLHINGRQSIARIALLIAKLVKRHAIFEFVALDDPNVVLLDTNRPIAYTLETVTKELAVHFRSIESHQSDRPTRKLLVCSK